MRQFIKNVHIRLCLLLIPAALCISGCDDGPTQTCCNYFSKSEPYISVVDDPEQDPRELLYIFATTVRSFAKNNDKTNANYISAGEYLCSIMPEMKGMNDDYQVNNNQDAMNVCAESIPRYGAMANKIKEAWDNCCYVLGSHVLEIKENACDKLNSDSEASAKCLKELENSEFEYLSCFRTYITQDRCEYIIN